MRPAIPAFTIPITISLLVLLIEFFKDTLTMPKLLRLAGLICSSIMVCSIALSLYWPSLSWAGDKRVVIARFSHSDLSDWQSKTFTGVTRYALADENGQTVLRADSSGGASGLYREVRINLDKTPVLNWTWRIGNILSGGDERTRAGDDYPARVYVIFSGGPMFWRTRAINYVWSNKQPSGSSWPNAYTGNARMLAVESGADRVGQWVEERRDVRADYRRVFGEEPGRVDAVAIMTDTDNTGTTATAWYGDIWFSAE
ncbi:DUF3047 domain-containing protein [Nitrosovibrio sp. Nv6]|uniref:DUF3047 domain-containing protein n=1 Tax=Nitrosovibrio sp. Nv6 TaxID=1855340 RepID=UPI0008CBCBD2|nr:DUF3047 domain-containing protein [Nitrosovibrio sp. Nv6]SEO86878.1 Protein of unknown function [Nitrosovibrio sp. Nv6]